MTIISPTTAPEAAAPSTKPEVPKMALLGSDFSTFLRMLTTQLKNQDPMNPMENSEFAVQLATFSGVEQQLKTNALLEALQTQLGFGGLAQYAGWVGKEARAAMPVSFTGKAVTLYATPDAKATSAELICRNADGVIVSRESVALGSTSFTWAGIDAKGQSLPNGTYTFTLESLAGGAKIKSTPAESYARIAEVRTSANGTILLFEGGAEVSVSAVTALRGG